MERRTEASTVQQRVCHFTPSLKHCRKNVLLTSKECLPSCCNAFLQYVGLSVNLSVMYSNYVSVENYPYYSILPPQTSVFPSSYGTV